MAETLSAGVIWLNSLAPNQAATALLKCCGSKKFATRLASLRPFKDCDDLVSSSRDVWWNDVDISGWLEAFSVHPRIGDIDSLRKKFASAGSEWCVGEQSAALQTSNEETLQGLAQWNRVYEEKFGRVFIICATGQPVSAILAAIKERVPNQPIYELQMAAKEQQKITELRLLKLLQERPMVDPDAPPLSPSTSVDNALYAMQGTPLPHALHPPPPPRPLAAAPHAAAFPSQPHPHHELLRPPRPPITTHVLDTSLGMPGMGIRVQLLRLPNDGTVAHVHDAAAKEDMVGESITDSDGRSGPLMPPGATLQAGFYQLKFFTAEYFLRAHGKAGFFPHVTISFTVAPSDLGEHFHVPLLLSAFSYSTYRGS